MISPLALPNYAEAAEWAPQVGDIVENFSAIARVDAIDAERGILLRGMPNQGFGPNDRWYANPAKCRPVR